MKKPKLISTIVLITVAFVFLNILGCASSKVQKVTDTAVLDSLVAQKNFRIESERAYPQVTNSLVSISNSGLLPPGDTAGSINLIGNPNYLIIKGDSVSGYLPYFGERQMGGYPGNTNNGIEFNTLMKKYEASKAKKDSYTIRFTATDTENNTETYNVVLQLYPNMRSNIRINSSQRFPIQYSGNIVTKKSDEALAK